MPRGGTFAWPIDEGRILVLRSAAGRHHHGYRAADGTIRTNPRCGPMVDPPVISTPLAEIATVALCRYRWCFRDEVARRGIDPLVGHVSRAVPRPARRRVEEASQVVRRRLPNGQGWEDLGRGSATGTSGLEPPPEIERGPAPVTRRVASPDALTPERIASDPEPELAVPTPSAEREATPVERRAAAEAWRRLLESPGPVGALVRDGTQERALLLLFLRDGLTGISWLNGPARSADELLDRLLPVLAATGYRLRLERES